jgi:toxin CptA
MKLKSVHAEREIELKPSRLLGLLLVGMAALALVSIGLAALPGAIQSALGVAVIGLSAWGWRQARFTEALRTTAGGRLQCPDGQGEWCDVEVLGNSLVSPALIVLRYRPPGARVRTLVLLPDSAEADVLRRLRVSLRWARHTRSDTAFPDAG